MATAEVAERELPLVLTPESGEPGRAPDLGALGHRLGRDRAALEVQVSSHGAVLLRGYGPVVDTASFARAIAGFVPRLRAYIEGQSPRTELAQRVYNASDYPADRFIPLHHELSYTIDPPRWLLFGCQTPASSGGETLLLHGRHFCARLPERIARIFAGRGIRYVKNMHPGKGLGRSWQEHYQTDDRAQVEAHLLATDAHFEWRADGGLRIWRIRPAMVEHPGTGERVWFNQATLWHVSHLGQAGAALRQMLGDAALPTHAYFDTGEPMADELVDEIRALERAHAVAVAWQRGDVLVVDNHAVAHGRNPFTGERSLYVAMA